MIFRKDPKHICTSVDSLDDLNQQMYGLLLGHCFWSDLSFLTQQHVIEFSDSLLLLFELKSMLFIFFLGESL